MAYLYNTATGWRENLGNADHISNTEKLLVDILFQLEIANNGVGGSGFVQLTATNGRNSYSIADFSQLSLLTDKTIGAVFIEGTTLSALLYTAGDPFVFDSSVVFEGGERITIFYQ